MFARMDIAGMNSILKTKKKPKFRKLTLHEINQEFMGRKWPPLTLELVAKWWYLIKADPTLWQMPPGELIAQRVQKYERLYLPQASQTKKKRQMNLPPLNLYRRS